MKNNQPKTMRRNRRFNIFLIWLGEVNIIILIKVLAKQAIDTELAIVIVKCATILAVVVITGLSGSNIAYDLVNGRKKNSIQQLPEPSKEEEETQ